MLDARLPRLGEGKRRLHAETGRVERAAPTGRETLEWIELRIAQIVRRRQELREAGAAAEQLETNRRELVAAQQALSGLLIARHVRPAA